MQLAHLLVLTLCIALLCSCGTPGAPQPPSLELPKPAEDLVASRKGDRVTLSWTPLRETTDGQTIRRRGPSRVCLGVNEFPIAQCSQAVAELPPPELPAGHSKQALPRMEFVHTMPKAQQQQWPTGFATYAVEALNLHGRSAGLSNQVRVPLMPTLPPPRDLTAQVTSDGIVLGFTGALHEHESPRLRHLYRVYRHSEGNKSDALIAEIALGADPQASLVDRNFEWEHIYDYWIAVVTVLLPADGSERGEVEGDDSARVRVFAHDTFPPAAPVGLQAVFSGTGQQPFIDLTWAPNTESDLAGYNIYRREAGAAPARINDELVKTPAFRDPGVVAGHDYTYSVAAVDLRGNESPRSEETSESVP